MKNMFNKDNDTETPPMIFDYVANFCSNFRGSRMQVCIALLHLTVDTLKITSSFII